MLKKQLQARVLLHCSPQNTERWIFKIFLRKPGWNSIHCMALSNSFQIPNLLRVFKPSKNPDNSCVNLADKTRLVHPPTTPGQPHHSLLHSKWFYMCLNIELHYLKRFKLKQVYSNRQQRKTMSLLFHFPIKPCSHKPLFTKNPNTHFGPDMMPRVSNCPAH